MTTNIDLDYWKEVQETGPVGCGGRVFMLIILIGCAGFPLLFKPVRESFLAVILEGKNRVTITKSRNRDNIRHNTCSLCGYRWDWLPGTSKPVVNVRPDLIAEGQRKLEDGERPRLQKEEEERRRRADEEAAYHAFVDPNTPKFGK